MVAPELLDLPVYKDQQDHKVTQDLKDPQEPQAALVLQDPLAPRDNQVVLDRMGLQDSQDQQVSRDHKVLEDL